MVTVGVCVCVGVCSSGTMPFNKEELNTILKFGAEELFKEGDDEDEVQVWYSPAPVIHLQRLLFEWPSQHGAAWVPLLHLFNGLFSRTTWISRCQKGKTSLDFSEARDDGFLGCSGISWTICKQSAHLSKQITTPTVQHPSLKFYRLNALPDAQPTVSKHWRHWVQTLVEENFWKWLWLPWMHVVEFSSSCGRGISWIN